MEDVYNTHIKALESLISIHPNLVELVASENTKPVKVRANTRILGKEFSGVNSRDKIGYVRRKMEEEKCDCYVMTALDEIAYLLNSTPSIQISFSNDSSGRRIEL